MRNIPHSTIQQKKQPSGVTLLAVLFGVGIILGAGILFVRTASAQLLGTELNLVLSPRSPAPGEVITARVESFRADLDRATLSWYLNGALLRRGEGLTSIVLEVAPAGERTALRVVADTSVGVFEQRITLAPADVDLLWSAESYTPPFYRGRALPTWGTRITLVALPHFTAQNGASLSPGSLVYTWKRNGTVLGSRSGRGRNTLVIENASLVRSEETLSVVVESQDKRLRAEDSAVIGKFPPVARFYLDDPLLGVRYERALNESFTLPSEEIRLVAEPYFISAPKPTDADLEYRWSLDGRSITPFDVENAITFRQTGGAGQSRLSLDIRHVRELLQSASARLSLIFGN